MKHLRRDMITYGGIILLLVVSKLIIWSGEVSHPQARGSLLQWPQLGLLALLGLAAVLLAPAAGFASMWEKRVSQGQRFMLPLLLGIGFAAVEVVTSLLLDFPDFHVKFPYSIPVYTLGGTLYEIKYHLLPVVVLVWVINAVLGRKWRSESVFWVVALLLSLREPLAQVEMMAGMGMISGMFWTLEMFVQIYAANILPLWIFRRFGFLSMLIFRLTVYLLWHVVWPPIYFGTG